MLRLWSRLPRLPAGAVLVTDELLPSQLIALAGANLGAICTAEGGATGDAHVSCFLSLYWALSLALSDRCLVVLKVSPAMSA